MLVGYGLWWVVIPLLVVAGVVLLAVPRRATRGVGLAIFVPVALVVLGYLGWLLHEAVT